MEKFKHEALGWRLNQRDRPSLLVFEEHTRSGFTDGQPTGYFGEEGEQIKNGTPTVPQRGQCRRGRGNPEPQVLNRVGIFPRSGVSRGFLENQLSHRIDEWLPGHCANPEYVSSNEEIGRHNRPKFSQCHGRRFCAKTQGETGSP